MFNVERLWRRASEIRRAREWRRQHRWHKPQPMTPIYYERPVRSFGRAASTTGRPGPMQRLLSWAAKVVGHVLRSYLRTGDGK